MKLDYSIDKYIQMLRKDKDYFHTFIDKPGLAVGVLVLAPGEEDSQEPHDSNEVYLVLNGDGFLRIGSKDYEVSTNKMFFVAKDTQHFFHRNTKELIVVYFFGG